MRNYPYLSLHETYLSQFESFVHPLNHPKKNPHNTIEPPKKDTPIIIEPWQSQRKNLKLALENSIS